MSVKNELKEKTKTSIIDFFEVVFPNTKTKYYDLLLRIINNKLNSKYYCDNLSNNINYIVESVNNSEVTKKSFENIDPMNVSVFANFVGLIYNECDIDFKSINDFINYNENGLIEKNDITTYKTYEEIVYQISLANLKQKKNEFENQIIKIYENNEDDWLIIKPLSCDSSVKYGYGTKWCTAMKNDFDYFRRYSNNGNLLYCVNKKTGEKIAAYKDMKSDNEYSFWTMNDKRVDSMQTNLPYSVMSVISKDFMLCTKTNSELLMESLNNDEELFQKYFYADIQKRKLAKHIDGEQYIINTPQSAFDEPSNFVNY